MDKVTEKASKNVQELVHDVQKHIPVKKEPYCLVQTTLMGIIMKIAMSI